MKIEKVWEILEIGETKDVDAIVDAYRSKVVTVNPEDDPEGFKALREAFETAMAYANSDESESAHDEVDEVDPQFRPFVEKIREIYDDIDKRVDIELWKKLFEDPICNELDTADRAREEFLKVLLERFYLPHYVYKLADTVFMIRNESASLKERFAEDFIDYIDYHIDNEDFIGFSSIIKRDSFNDLLEERGIVIPEFPERKVDYVEPDYSCPEDDYLSAISPIVRDIEEVVNYQSIPSLDNAPEEIEKCIDELYGNLTFARKSRIFHPVEYSGLIRLFGFLDEHDKARYLAEQVVTGRLNDIADYYMKATACYYLMKEMAYDEGGEGYEYLSQIKEIIDGVLEARPKFNIALRARVFYYCVIRDYEKANDTLMSLFEIDANNADAIKILPYVNGKLVEYYDKKIEEEPGEVKYVIDKCWGLFRSDRVDDAIELLNATDIPEPFSIYYSDYYNILGRCYFKKEDFRSALPYLEKWKEALLFFESKKEKNPESLSEEETKKLKRLAYCFYLNGICKGDSGDYEKAEEYIKYAIANEHDEVDVPYYKEGLACCYHENHEYAKAMEIWNQMIEENRFYIAAYVRRQATAFEMHDAQLVIDDYYILQAHARKYVKSYYYAAKVFYIYDQYKNLEEVLAKAREEDIDSSALKLVEADMYLDKGDTDKAGNLLEEIKSGLQDEENDIIKFNVLNDYYLSFGRYYRMIGKSPEECYKEGLEKSPDSIGLNYSMGVLKFENDRYNEAIEYLDRTLELNPHHRAAHNKLSRVYDSLYYETEDPDNYRKAAEHAVKQLENDNDDYYYVESALLYNKGAEYEKSVIDCDKALEKDDTNYYAYNAKGVALMMLKDYEKAEESFLRGLKEMEGASNDDALPNLYHNLAKCYEMQFKYEKSVEILKELLKRFGENKTTHYRLALALNKAKRFDESVKEYMKVARINEDSFRNSKNEWNLNNLFEVYVDIYNTRLHEHNKKAADAIFKTMLKKFIDDYRLLDLGGKNAVRFENKNVAAYILERYSAFYLYSLREYKKALKIAERALSYLGPYRQIKDNNLLHTYMDISSTIMVSAAYIGKPDRARDAAKEINECIKAISKDKVDNYLEYTENSTYRKKEYALMLYFLGEKDKALQMLRELADAPRCRACRHAKCYEAYLMNAKICEFEHDIPAALEYYKKANETGAEDSEVISAMNLLTGGKN